MSSRTVSRERFKYAPIILVSHKSIATGSGAGLERCSSNFSKISSEFIVSLLVWAGGMSSILAYPCQQHVTKYQLDELVSPCLAGADFDLHRS